MDVGPVRLAEIAFVLVAGWFCPSLRPYLCPLSLTLVTRHIYLYDFSCAQKIGLPSFS